MEDIALIINKDAKNSQESKQYINALQQHDFKFDLFAVQSSELIKILPNLKNNYSIMLMGGGDGSIRSAAQVCVNTESILGVIPIGTMNHFAKELQLPNTPDDLIDALHKKNYS